LADGGYRCFIAPRMEWRSSFEGSLATA